MLLEAKGVQKKVLERGPRWQETPDDDEEGEESFIPPHGKDQK